MARQVLLAAIFVSWGLSSLHAIRAQRTSPEASVFRPFWRNKYSAAGRKHLRWQALWGALAAAFTLLYLFS